MKQRKVWARTTLVFFLCAQAAFAQSETTIINGVNEVLRKVIMIVGPSVLGYGLVRAFMAHSAGDEDGMRSARNAVVGGLGILFTFTLVRMIVQAAGVAGY